MVGSNQSYIQRRYALAQVQTDGPSLKCGITCDTGTESEMIHWKQ